MLFPSSWPRLRGSIFSQLSCLPHICLPLQPDVRAGVSVQQHTCVETVFKKGNGNRRRTNTGERVSGGEREGGMVEGGMVDWVTNTQLWADF